MDDFAVKIENVSKYYKLYNTPRDRLKEALHPGGKPYHKKFYALNNINLTVKKGEIVGIIGSNGSGKSTLLKLIAKVLTPNSGSVEVNGSVSALLELGAGFNPDFTGIENLYFYATILGLPKTVIDEKLDDILAFADIGEFINQPLKTYSNGMKARLGFAIATEIDPDILIIDEVLAVGDATFQRKCYARIENFLNKGKTVFLVSHNRNSIVSLCDKAILLDHGKIQGYDKSNKVIDLYEKLINKQFHKDKNTETTKIHDADRPQEEDTGQKASSEILYDNSLTTKPVLLQSSKVEFKSFSILDENNSLVNTLSSGCTYKIQANFSFHEDLENLTFALRIKTKQGIMVSWSSYPFERRKYLSAKKDDNLSLMFSFDCNLLDGVFTIDAALQSTINDNITIHVGYQDIYIFKINKTKYNNHGISFMNLNDAQLSYNP